MIEQSKSFEEAVSELEALLNEVENGSMPLEKMVERISHGAELVKYCQQKLKNLNGKVELLFKDDGAAGEFEEFDTSSERAKAAGASRKTATKPASQVMDQQDDLPF